MKEVKWSPPPTPILTVKKGVQSNENGYSIEGTCTTEDLVSIIDTLISSVSVTTGTSRKDILQMLCDLPGEPDVKVCVYK